MRSWALSCSALSLSALNGVWGGRHGLGEREIRAGNEQREAVYKHTKRNLPFQSEIQTARGNRCWISAIAVGDAGGPSSIASLPRPPFSLVLWKKPAETNALSSRKPSTVSHKDGHSQAASFLLLLLLSLWLLGVVEREKLRLRWIFFYCYLLLVAATRKRKKTTSSHSFN